MTPAAEHTTAVGAAPRVALQLLSDGPVRPTPAGAFRAVARRDPGPVGRMLRAILHARTTPSLSLDALVEWTGAAAEAEALEILYAAQEDGLIEGVDEALRLSDQPLEQLIPPLLATLSDEGKALLADPDGLPVWSSGFEPEIASRLAALSGDLASVQERHGDALVAVLGEEAGAWALVDGVGASRIGCWPIHVADTRFVLVAQGLPRMHHLSFTLLVWLLVHRYG